MLKDKKVNVLLKSLTDANVAILGVRCNLSLEC